MKPRKFHKTKKLHSKRKEASSDAFEEMRHFKTLHPMQELELQAPAMEKQEFPENDSSLASQSTEKHV